MNDIGDMLIKAYEGVTRQFNAQVEASIAMLVNSGIPLERIELINRTTEDMSVVTEVRSRTSDEAQAVAIEREAAAGWHESRADELRFVAARYFRLGQREAGKITEAELHTHRLSAINIRNGEHVKP